MNEPLAQDGLSDQQRDAIVSIFKDYPQIKSAYLCGSRALGRYRAGSDIDLTLFGDVDLETLNKISPALDDLLLPYEIDLSVYQSIENADLREHIERVGRVFYEKE